MALVTRCPKCGTMFRVVPDQLRVSSGWVCCGQCREVFDAAQHMMPRGTEMAVLGEVREGGRDGSAERGVQGKQSAQRAHEMQDERENGAVALTNSAGMLQRREGTHQYRPAGLSTTPENEAVGTALSPRFRPQSQPPASRRPPGAPDTAFMAELDAACAAVVSEPAAPPPVPAVQVQGGGAGREPPPSGSVDLLLSELGKDIAEGNMAPSFVQRARRRQAVSRYMRALLWLGLVALMLTLVLQVLISERNWLAARQPALAPALRGLCSVFNCRVGPYRHIEAIVIDNSGFSRAVDGSFQFHYSLRNQANLPVATPALELTLTDMQERPLVRRVISVRELGAPASIAARGEFSGARSITLSSAANPSAVTGYKLVAFYP